MRHSEITSEFNQFCSQQPMNLEESVREFCVDRGLTLGELAVLVSERPGLRNIAFLSVAEVVLLQQPGRPTVYGDFYEHLSFVVRGLLSNEDLKVSFSDAYGMAKIRARKNEVEKIAPYSSALLHAKKHLGWTK